MPIESMDGLVQALSPESGVTADDVRAFIDAQAIAAAEPWKSKHNAAHSDLRKVKSTADELARERESLSAELANLRESASKAGEYETRLAEINAQFEALKSEHERASRRAAKYDRGRWEQHIMEAGEIARVEDAHYLVDHLGLTPQFDDADHPVLDDAAEKRLKDFLAKPANKAKYVTGGRSHWQSPGRPDPTGQPPKPYIPPTVTRADPHTADLIARHTGIRG